MRMRVTLKAKDGGYGEARYLNGVLDDAHSLARFVLEREGREVSEGLYRVQVVLDGKLMSPEDAKEELENRERELNRQLLRVTSQMLDLSAKRVRKS